MAAMALETLRSHQLRFVKDAWIQLDVRRQLFSRSQLDEFVIKLLDREFTSDSWTEDNPLGELSRVRYLTLYEQPTAAPKATICLHAPIDPDVAFRFTAQSHIQVFATSHHVLLVLDLSASVRTIGGKAVQLDRVFDTFRTVWASLSQASERLRIRIVLSVLIDTGDADQPVVYLARVRVDCPRTFKWLVRQLNDFLADPPCPSASPHPTDLGHLLRVCLQCTRYSQCGLPSVVVVTDGVLGTKGMDQTVFELAALDIPVHVYLLALEVQCLGMVPEVEILQHVARSTGGKFLQQGTAITANDMILKDKSYDQRIPRQFTPNLYPPSHHHLAFPWDSSGPLLTNCIPTRYRDYEVLLPLQVIKARLRQGFLIHNVVLRDKISVHLVLNWLPYVTIQYRIKSFRDMSAGRVEVNVVAYREFTMALLKQGYNPAAGSEVNAFHEFLKAIVDQDGVHRVINEVAAGLVRNPGQEAVKKYQLIEALLKTHAQWMDEEVLSICRPRVDIEADLKALDWLVVSGYYVQPVPKGSGQFGFTAVHVTHVSDSFSTCRCLFYNYRVMPECLLKGRINGFVSVAHGTGTNAALNASLLQRKRYAYAVSPELQRRMRALTVHHYKEEGYMVVESLPESTTLAKKSLQCTISCQAKNLVIDYYQIPGIHTVESSNLYAKLSAIYTIDCLLQHKKADNDKLFSLRNVLTHSRMTVLGLSTLDVTIPVDPFMTALRSHLASVCFPAPPYLFGHDNVHRAVHTWHDLATPASDFECHLYLSSTVIIFFIPTNSAVPYVIVYECFIDQMVYHVWQDDELPMIPHSRARIPNHPVANCFYYMPYHISTLDIEDVLTNCAWLSTVDCVYKYATDMDPAHVARCVECLHEVTATVDISRTLAAMEMLRRATGGHQLEPIERAKRKFDADLAQFMVLIPNTTVFTVRHPNVFCRMTLALEGGAAPVRVASLPTPAASDSSALCADPNWPTIWFGDVDVPGNLDLLSRLQLQLNFYSLERDVNAFTGIIDEVVASLNRTLTFAILDLLLPVKPVTAEMLQLVSSDLRVLPRYKLPLDLYESENGDVALPPPLPLLVNEFQVSRLPGYHIVFQHPFFYLVPVAPAPTPPRQSLDLDMMDDLEAGLGIVLNPVEIPQLRGPVFDEMREWIIFTVESSLASQPSQSSQSLHVRLFTLSKDIMKPFQKMVAETAHRVNTRLMLMELRDTHESAEALIPPDKDDIASKGIKKVGPVKNKKKSAFKPGQFACPVQYTYAFTLPKRIQDIPLRNIGMLLISLAVTNRENHFVVSKGEEVFYMRLSLSHPSTAWSRHGDDESMNITSPPSSAIRRLIMDLHGMDEPSRDLANGIVNMVTERLSGLVLTALSGFLVTSSTAKLDKADIEFLLPISRGPRLSMFVPIRVAVDPLYLLFLRQSILQFTTVFGREDVTRSLSQHLQVRYDVVADSLEHPPGEMGFVYCSVSKLNPTPWELAIGQGIGCIVLYMTEDRHLLLNGALNPAAEHAWMVELWVHGSLHADVLLQYVEQANVHAELDVSVDLLVKARDWSSIPRLLTAQDPASTRTPHPCAFHKQIPVRLAEWKRAEFLQAIQEQFSAFAFECPDDKTLVYCESSAKQADQCFYSATTPCFKDEKVAWVHVPRSVLLLVVVESDVVHLVQWNLKAPLFATLVRTAEAYVAQYRAHMDQLRTMALSKLGVHNRRVQSFQRRHDRVLHEPPLAPSSAQTTAVPAAATAAAEHTNEEPESPSATVIVVPEQQLSEFNEYLKTVQEKNQRAQHFLNIYSRWRQRHQRRLQQYADRPCSPSSPLPSLSSYDTSASVPSSSLVPAVTASTDEFSDSDLEHVLRYARLIHWCRTPIVFNCRVENSYSFVPNDVNSNNATEARSYFARLLPDLFAKYCDYLMSLGLVQVSQQQERKSFSISSSDSLPTDRVYLQKSFQGGILLAEVSINHVFLAVNLYTVNRRYGPHQQRLPSPGFTVPDYSRQSFRLFTEECTKFKNLIHVNSFVFDYHLLELRQVIKSSTLVVYSVVDVMRCLLHHFPPAGYSKCRLLQDVVAESSSSLVTYLFSHPVRFQLGLIPQSNACFVVRSWSQSQRSNAATEADGPPGNALNGPSREWLIVMRQVPAGIEYFVLDCIKAKCARPHLTLGRKHTEELASAADVSVESVRAQSRDAVASLLQLAAAYYERDRKWQSLLDNRDLELTEFVATARQFFCTSLVALDPRLHVLLQVPGDWNAIAEKLKQEWPHGVRTIGMAASAEQLIMLVNHNESALYLLSLHPPHVNVVVRDEREQNVGDVVNYFVRLLSKVIWQCLVT
ncbi:hypothetical protein GGF32_000635 [Allomyces javanicus]|nr:hypothetical protein GGF32_000635 [Allomyces javanicus]